MVNDRKKGKGKREARSKYILLKHLTTRRKRGGAVFFHKVAKIWEKGWGKGGREGGGKGESIISFCQNC